MLLALETANDQCSVALYDGEAILAERSDMRSREQARLILPMIDVVLAERQMALADLSVIAFSRGAGSFSGVRINAAVAQGLAWAQDLPVVAVSTLQATAQAAWRQQQLKRVVVSLDARMKELYCAEFALDNEQIMQPVADEQLLAYDALDLSQRDRHEVAVVGSGCAHIQHPAQLAVYAEITAHAQDVARLGYAMWQAGLAGTAAEALPVYLRDNAWKKIADQKKTAH